MPGSTHRVRKLIRRIVGSPIGSGRVQGRWPVVLDRHQALFESIMVPPLPIPLLLVHTGGKPLDYLSRDRRRLKQSLPGLVTFVPRGVRAEVALRGVGEGTVVYFDDARALPAWLLRGGLGEPATFTNDVIVSITRRLMSELAGGPVPEVARQRAARRTAARARTVTRDPRPACFPWPAAGGARGQATHARSSR